MTTLFKNIIPAPLADSLRPTSLADIVGQEHLLSPSGSLTQMVTSGTLTSIILWGPPGCGKTTLAHLLAGSVAFHFEPISAIFCGVNDLKKVFAAAQSRRQMGQGTLLFIDEIHRFNRVQQDSFLPFVENGTITLIGATTENPSFELNGALLSRCLVMTMNPLDSPALEKILTRAEEKKGSPLPLTDDAREALILMADGDGRSLLNYAEHLFSLPNKTPWNRQALAQLLTKRVPKYDKKQDQHFNLISALHKSMRGSDTDAALYWFTRMIESGEDPGYIARRLVRFATEDIGLADPNALQHALAAWQSYERIGSPEGVLALINSVIYLCSCPKSNAAYLAQKNAKAAVARHPSFPPPKHILNAPTSLMKDLAYGKNYIYDHDTAEGCSGQNYFPEDMPRQTYYEPSNRGFEREIRKRLQYWQSIRTKHQSKIED